jgi:hypothetical protein
MQSIAFRPEVRAWCVTDENGEHFGVTPLLAIEQAARRSPLPTPPNAEPGERSGE